MSAAAEIAGAPVVGGAEVSDAELVAMYRETKSDVAFSELIRRHQIGIFRLLLTLLGDPDEAEKLCEQTFFEVARKLDELTDPAGFQPWLAGVARGLVQKAEAARGKQQKKRPARKVVPAAEKLVTIGSQQIAIMYDLADDGLQKDLGPMPQTPLEQGILQTVDIFRRLQSEGRLDTADLDGPQPKAVTVET